MNRSAFIEAFLRTGDPDPSWGPWGGDADAGAAVLRRIVSRIVTFRSEHAPLPPAHPPADLITRVDAHIASMLTGLLPADRVAPARAALTSRVEVVTLDQLPRQLRMVSPADGWSLANLLLEDLGAPPLSDGAPTLDGLAAAGRAWVSPRAFRVGGHPHVDIIVHEIAHLLHTVPASDLGLTGTEPLIPLSPVDRETFAYGCEVWACVQRGRSGGDIPTSLAAFFADPPHLDARVDRAKLRAALLAAAGSPGDGWAEIRVITTRASAPRPTIRATPAAPLG